MLKTRGGLVQKQYMHYPAELACGPKSIEPLSIGLAATTALDLEQTTRGNWLRHRLREGVAGLVDVPDEGEESDDENDEVVAAVVKVVRTTTVAVSRIKRRRLSDDGDRDMKEAIKRARGDGLDHAIAVRDVEDDEEPSGTVEGSSVATTPRDEAARHIDLASNVLVVDSDSDSDGEPSQEVDGTPGVFMEAPEAEIPIRTGCPDERCWARRHLLFSKFDEGIMMDRSAWYEVSPEVFAKHVARRVSRTVQLDGDTRRVLAGCCGVGGDAIQLAVHGLRAVAVDIDATKVDACRHNAAIYGVEDKLEYRCADLVAYSLEQEVSQVTETVQVTRQLDKTGDHPISFPATRVVRSRPFSWGVISPPWGGPEYKQLYSFALAQQTFLDLIRLIQAAMRVCDNLALILPRNSDVQELVQLAAHGSPDDDRFVYLEVEQLLTTGHRYPKYIVAYFARSLNVLLAGDPLKERTMKFALTPGEFPKPQLKAPRPPLGDMIISMQELSKVRESRGTDPAEKAETGCWLSRARVLNLVLCRFLLVYLQEQASQIAAVELALELIGLAEFLQLIEQTVRVCRAGGLQQKKDVQQKRSKGGVFFELLKQRLPEVNKNLRKFRKRQIELQFKKKEATVPTTDV